MPPRTESANPPIIHALGDSHASFFAGEERLQPLFPAPAGQNLHAFRAWHLGPYLAHSFANPQHELRRKIRQLSPHFAAGHRLLLCLGEIDCRCHVLRQSRLRSSSIRDTAAALANRYALAAARFRDSINRDVALWAAVAQCPHRTTVGPYTTVGSHAHRAAATRAFNGTLFKLAPSLSLPFVYIDTDDDAHPSRRDESLFMDQIHLSQRAIPRARNALLTAGLIDRDSPAARHIDPALTNPLKLLARGCPPVLVSHKAKIKLFTQAADRCRAKGFTRIAILGAGQHLQAITLKPFLDAGLRILAICDPKRPRRRLFDRPILRPVDLPSNVQAIIPCSDAHEAALIAHFQQSPPPHNPPIIRVYTRFQLSVYTAKSAI